MRVSRSLRVAGLDTRAIVSTLSRAAVLVLAAFHGWLLWSRLADGRFLEPAVALRWIAGGLILAGFLAVGRLGGSAFTSRKALVLWLFVVLLHCQAIGAPSGANFDQAVLPETVAALTANLALVTVTVALGLALLARAHRDDAARLLALQGFVVRSSAPAVPAAGVLPQFSSRPPPA